MKCQYAKQIVGLIIDDLKDRCGLQDAWDEIDGKTKKEIIAEWTKLVKEEIEAN